MQRLEAKSGNQVTGNGVTGFRPLVSEFRSLTTDLLNADCCYQIANNNSFFNVQLTLISIQLLFYYLLRGLK